MHDMIKALEAEFRKKDKRMDIFGEPAYDYFDETSPFTDAYRMFYGGEEEIKEPETGQITICDYVRDTYAYYGKENLPTSIEWYQISYNNLCTISGISAKFELNETMAQEAAQTKADKEKTEKSRPLWNALKLNNCS